MILQALVAMISLHLRIQPWRQDCNLRGVSETAHVDFEGRLEIVPAFD